MTIDEVKLKWLKQYFPSWVFSTQDGSFGSKKVFETTESLSRSQLPQHLSSCTCSADAHGLSTLMVPRRLQDQPIKSSVRSITYTKALLRLQKGLPTKHKLLPGRERKRHYRLIYVQPIEITPS